MLYCEEYYEGINHPRVKIGMPICDGCRCQPLTEYEYYNFIKPINGSTKRHCNECWNHMHLIVWTDKKGHKHAERSERR